MLPVKNILLVENNQIIALDLKILCQQLGHSCTYTPYGEEAFQKAKQIQPDLILMDLDVKTNQNIIDEAEKICNQFNIPIIFFTRAPQNLYKDHRLQRKCLFHPVPYSREILIEEIEGLLKNYIHEK